MPVRPAITAHHFLSFTRTMNKSLPRVLILDPDSGHSGTLEAICRKENLHVEHCSTIAQAVELIPRHGESLIAAFIALDLPDGEGLDLLRRDGLLPDGIEVALMHDSDDPERASTGISLQARYFFCKPVDESFIAGLLGDIREEWLTRQDGEAEPLDCSVDQFGLLRGSSRPMRKLYRTIRKLAPTSAAVLLVGESGTGKEVAAETIHLLSGLDGPFVAINCGAIPAELAESELFGHEKGSFSGADKQHAGCFERAGGGTLFLDEIAEMPLEIQVKLLRVLETGTYRRVGGEKELKADVRIISATNREPEDAIRDEVLREDLYFRVAQFPLHIPALRDRGDDVIGLAQFFLARLNDQHDTAKTMAESAVDAIRDYAWPGNVRELQSAVERAYIMAEQELEGQHFPLEQLGIEPDGEYLRVPVGQSLDVAEKKLILATLEATDGDKRAAAEQLGISLKTLYNRLKDYEAD